MPRAFSSMQRRLPVRAPRLGTFLSPFRGPVVSNDGVLPPRPMRTPPPVLMSTDDVAARDRAPYWADWIQRLFHGLQSDLYGDFGMEGRLASACAGDVVLTRLEATASVNRSSEAARAETSATEDRRPFGAAPGSSRKAGGLGEARRMVHLPPNHRTTPGHDPVEHLPYGYEANLREPAGQRRLMARRLGGRRDQPRGAGDKCQRWSELRDPPKRAQPGRGDHPCACNCPCSSWPGADEAVQRETMSERSSSTCCATWAYPQLVSTRRGTIGVSRRQLYNASPTSRTARRHLPWPHSAPRRLRDERWPPRA